jgi:hypothetical protein
VENHFPSGKKDTLRKYSKRVSKPKQKPFQSEALFKAIGTPTILQVATPTFKIIVMKS